MRIYKRDAWSGAKLTAANCWPARSYNIGNSGSGSLSFGVSTNFQSDEWIIIRMFFFLSKKALFENSI
jgi:hypothetical protein